MRKIYLFLLSLCCSALTMAQVAVNVTNPANTTPALAASYTSLSDAITALDAITAISGPVTLTCAAGAETAPSGGYVINYTAVTTATNNVVIIGTGVTITAASPAGTVGNLNDAIFKIIGSDFATIQGFTMLENAANTTTVAATNNMVEWGVALLYASTTNGAQNNTILNNTITLNKTYQNTFGIYSNSAHSATAISTGVSATTAAGGNSGLKIYGNNISNVNNGIAVVGPTAAADFNNGIDIGGTSGTTGNTISNYGTTGTFSGFISVSGTIFGVLVRNSTAINVSYNNITSPGSNTAGTMRGIYVPAFTATPTGTFTNTFNNNTISVATGLVGGALQGIAVEATTGTATSSISISNNNFTNASYTVASPSGTVNMILDAMAHLNTTINGNTFTNLLVNTTGSVTLVSNSITFPAGGSQTISNNAIVTAFNKTGAGGTVTGITSGGSSTTGTSTWANNNFSNITVTGATAFTFINNTDGGTINHNITGNTLNNITGGTSAIIGINSSFGGGNGGAGNLIANNTITNIIGGGAITAIGIGSSGTSSTVTGNTIGALESSGASLVVGITSAAPTSNNIFKNKIYDLSNSNAGGTITGIAVTAGTLHTVYNNTIGNLTAPAANAANPIIGLNITGGTTVNAYYNTVRLAGTSSGALFGSSAASVSTTPTVILRNNIFINLCTPVGATGFASAHRRSSATLTNYAAASNNNLFYAGTPGVNNLIFFDGTNSDQTLAAYKIRVSTRDANSVTENTTFASTTGSSVNFLHIAAATSTLAESGAINITGITDDFDTDVRQGNPGYAGTGIGPDMGADEFEGTNPSISPIDMGATALITPLTIGCFGAAETVTVTIKNSGSAIMDFAATPVTVTTQVTGAVTQTLSVVVNTGTLASGASTNVTMSTTLDMTAAGTYTFNAATAVTGDGNAANDAMASTNRTVTGVAALPQSVDFTGFTGANLTTLFPNWYEATGATLPTGTTSGWVNQSSWSPSNVTAKINLYSNTANDWIVGPKVLVTAGALLNFSVAITDYNNVAADPSKMAGTDDKVVVKISTDCGQTFSDLMVFNASNTGSITNTLVPQSISLAPYVGQQVIIAFFGTDGPIDDLPDYDFHIDNIKIFVPAANDISTMSLVAPTPSTGCYGPAETVTISVKNTGTGAIDFSTNPLTVTTQVTGAATQTLTGSINTGTLATGASLNVNMSATLNMSAAGTYTFNASAALTGDGDATNDALSPAVSITKSAIFAAIASGDWTSSSTWCGGIIPGCSDIVNIPTGINVTVNAGAANCKTLTIASGGTLTVSSSSITVGCTLNNATLTNNGTLTVSGGTLNVNGNILLASGSTFNQSSGAIVIDGNDGTLAANSVASGTTLLLINSATGSVTGGTITIVDPNFNTSGKALDYNVSSTPMVWGNAHTLRIGNGISTDASANTSGFILEQYTGTGKLALGNLTISGGATANRWTSLGGWSTFVNGTLTVDAGSEFRINSSSTPAVFAGNIINNGTITSTVGVSLASTSGNSTVVNPNPQTIGGIGVYRNLVASPTANFTSLLVNNVVATGGVTLNIPVSVSGTLTLTDGRVITSTTNVLTLGTSPTSLGTLARTNGFVAGPFRRYYGAATTAFGNLASLLPVGGLNPVSSTNVYYPAEVAFTSAPSAGGTLTAEYIPASAGNAGLPQSDGAYSATDIYTEGYWKIDNTGITGGTYGVRLTGSDFASLQLWTANGEARVIKRASGAGTWGAFEGTHTNGSSYTVQRDGLTTFSEFAITKSTIVLPITLQYFKGAKTNAGNSVEWKVNCTSAHITMEIERSADTRNFNRITSVTADQLRCNTPFYFTDAQPLKAINYYRLKMIDMDGKVSYSAVIAIINADKGIEIVGMYPTVVNNSAFLSIAAAKAGKIQTIITDMSGKLIQSANQAVAEGSSLLTVDCSTLSAGVYHITGYIDGARTKTIRFIKL